MTLRTIGDVRAAWSLRSGRPKTQRATREWLLKYHRRSLGLRKRRGVWQITVPPARARRWWKALNPNVSIEKLSRLLKRHFVGAVARSVKRESSVARMFR